MSFIDFPINLRSFRDGPLRKNFTEGGRMLRIRTLYLVLGELVSLYITYFLHLFSPFLFLDNLCYTVRPTFQTPSPCFKIVLVLYLCRSSFGSHQAS